MIRAIAFDFDGVLVESGEVKTRAFAHLFRAEPSDVVERIVRYHEQYGGIVRFEKFRTIYREILQRPLSPEQFQALCDAFAALVVDEVVAAPWVAGAEEFVRRHAGRYAFFIISGTPEPELRDIARRRGMTPCFAEILGAPERIWVNPDCGLRTRTWDVAFAKLQNLVEGARLAREALARA